MKLWVGLADLDKDSESKDLLLMAQMRDDSTKVFVIGFIKVDGHAGRTVAFMNTDKRAAGDILADESWIEQCEEPALTRLAYEVLKRAEVRLAATGGGG